jgi:hypothetical protein
MCFIPKSDDMMMTNNVHDQRTIVLQFFSSSRQLSPSTKDCLSKIQIL